MCIFNLLLPVRCDDASLYFITWEMVAGEFEKFMSNLGNVANTGFHGKIMSPKTPFYMRVTVRKSQLKIGTGISAYISRTKASLLHLVEITLSFQIKEYAY